MASSSRTLRLMFAAFLVCKAAFSEAATKEELRPGNATSSMTAAMVAIRKPVISTGGTCESRVVIYGYKCEEHTVTTQDGYILSLQRIPNGRRPGSQATGIKKPVLLQHGLMMDGNTWLLNSPEESLGYILADNGYDVWIANSRGTAQSLGHTSLSPSDSLTKLSAVLNVTALQAYWDWSWDELAAYELPAIFQYVYQQTGNQKIHYVGHSLATTTVLTSLSEKNLLSMVRSTVLLGPCIYMDQMSSPLARAAADTFVAQAYYWLGLHRFDPKGEVVNELLEKLCILPWINCLNKMTVFTGKNCCLNSSAVEVFLDHEPQPTSTRNLIHMSQMIRKGTFTKYDYDDSNENLMHYGQSSPPAYNIDRIPKDLPLFISFGGTDMLADANDVEHLLNALKIHHQVDKLEVKYVNNYAHADFVMAVNAREVLYDPMMTFFQHH